jgi:hypothetical protein
VDDADGAHVGGQTSPGAPPLRREGEVAAAPAVAAGRRRRRRRPLRRCSPAR